MTDDFLTSRPSVAEMWAEVERIIPAETPPNQRRLYQFLFKVGALIAVSALLSTDDDSDEAIADYILALDDELRSWITTETQHIDDRNLQQMIAAALRRAAVH